MTGKSKLSLSALQEKNPWKHIGIQDDEKAVELMDSEYAHYTKAGAPPNMSTLTWFEGNHRTAHKVVRERVMEIRKKYPWLAGRIVVQDKKAYLVYKKKPTMDPFVYVWEKLSPIQRGDTLDFMRRQGKWMSLQKNGDFEPLWRVTLVPCRTNPNSHFCVIMSMCHAIGDGHTYYKILNALFSKDPLPPLKLDRLYQSEEQRVAAMGKDVATHSVGGSLQLWRGLAHAKLAAPLKSQKIASRYFLVDNEAILAMKEHASEKFGVPYVSTNDVIASWFFRETDCLVQGMSVNLRNRLAGHTDEHAGNYETFIYYNRQDTENPALIRGSLRKLKRVVTPDHVPNSRELARGTSAYCSNWSTYMARSMAIEGCKTDLHLPLPRLANASTVVSCVIFKPYPDRTAVLVRGKPSQLEKLEHPPFLSDDVLE